MRLGEAQQPRVEPRIAAGRQELRRGIFEFARTVDDQDRRERLVRLAAEIGTP